MRQNQKANWRELIGFDDRLVMALGIPLVGFLVPIIFFGEELHGGFLDYLPSWIISALYTACYWIAIRAIMIRLRRKYPAPEHSLRRIGWMVLLFAPIYWLICFVLKRLQITLAAFHEHTIQSELQLYSATLTVTLLCVSLYEATYFFFRWKESELEREHLQKINVESQLESLRAQVNPHFLFNSLNTLTYLIPDDPEKATIFVQELSRVYRYILEIRDKRLVTLGEELDFLDAYLFLLNERFGENLRVSISVQDEDREALVLPLSMQLLFENAIKHNIISSTKPLHISLRTFQDKLEVRNNLQRKHNKRPGTRVGLQNIRDRYAFYTHQRVKVKEDQTDFVVSLPLLWQTAPLTRIG